MSPLLKIFLVCLAVQAATASFSFGKQDFLSSLKLVKQTVLGDKLQSCTYGDFMKYVPAGYPVEMHEVVTDDGFKLNLFRIQKQGTQIRKGLHPVILQHGIDDSALAWVQDGPTDSFAFMLANAGYDVWLGNNRGNRFSREHVSLKPWEKAFWAWSFQQMAQYDQPANFRKIRQITGAQKITYVGHSQGTTQMFAALADKETNPKIAPYLEAFHAFAPVLFLTNTKIAPLQLAKKLEHTFQSAMNLLHLHHFGLGKCDFDPNLVTKYQNECSKKQCNFDWMTDPNPKTINYYWYGYSENASPGGYSTQCLVHFAQLIAENRKAPYFSKYDYGSYEENKKHYGQNIAPLYDLGLIKSKVFLYMGDSDQLADSTDVSMIPAQLPNAQVKLLPQKSWGHCAFTQPNDKGAFYSSVINSISMSARFTS
jgi:pimeloyl-ACP methyl ester carboxylesterase